MIMRPGHKPPKGAIMMVGAIFGVAMVLSLAFFASVLWFVISVYGWGAVAVLAAIVVSAYLGARVFARIEY